VGARKAVTTSSTRQAVIDEVTNYSNGVGIHGVEVSVNPDPATAVSGTSITVSTTIDYADVSWLRTPWFMAGRTLASTSVMRKEGF
jgi:hypothetical protein